MPSATRVEMKVQYNTSTNANNLTTQIREESEAPFFDLFTQTVLASVHEPARKQLSSL